MSTLKRRLIRKSHHTHTHDRRPTYIFYGAVANKWNLSHEFGKFKVVHLVVNDVTYDKRNSNWHFILLPNWCRSSTHSLTHAWCDADEIEWHQRPLQNVNIEKDLYQISSHRKFCCVSANGNHVSNTSAYGSVHVTCEWIFCFSGLCILYSVHLKSIPSSQLHRCRFKSIKEKFLRGIHARIQWKYIRCKFAYREPATWYVIRILTTYSAYTCIFHQLILLDV